MIALCNKICGFMTYISPSYFIVRLPSIIHSPKNTPFILIHPNESIFTTQTTTKQNNYHHSRNTLQYQSTTNKTIASRTLQRYSTLCTMTTTATLPNLDHFRMADAAKVYEPAEDTFLLCDAIFLDKDFLYHMNPHYVLEIGCGSGCVITYTTKLLREGGINPFSMATDINPDALAVTQRTATHNNVTIDCIQTDLVTAVEDRLTKKIDVLIFNPPYVPTESNEIGGNGIEASWAGGIDGREVIDRLLPKFKNLLSPQGVCYMVVVKENKPSEISKILAKDCFESKLVITRRAVNEELSIMKITRKR